jgi:hypothetical protein
MDQPVRRHDSSKFVAGPINQSAVVSDAGDPCFMSDKNTALVDGVLGVIGRSLVECTATPDRARSRLAHWAAT